MIFRIMLEKTFISFMGIESLKDSHRLIIIKTKSSKPAISTSHKKTTIITNRKDRSREKTTKSKDRSKYTLKPQLSKS